MKKILAIMLCIVMLLSFMPIISWAAGTIQYAAITDTDTNDPNTYEVVNNKTQYSITLSDYEANKGQIRLNDSGEGPNAERQYNEGDEIRIEIEVNNGFQVSDLLINGDSVGAVTSYTIDSIDKNYIIDVLFTQATYTINASAGVGGSISPLGIIPVGHGSNQSFTINPDEGYIIQDVIIDGEFYEGPINTFEFTNIEGNRSIEAVFEPASTGQHQVTLNYNTNAGSIRIDGYYEGDGRNITVNDGNTIQVEIEAQDRYKISKVAVGEISHEDFPDRFYSFQAQITTNTAIAVEFAEVKYKITVSSGENGTISPSGNIDNVEHGSNKQFVITPDNGYEIDQVMVNNEPILVHNRVGFMYELQYISEDYTINTTFKPIGDPATIHTITVEIFGSGTVEAFGLDNGGVSVQDGFSHMFTIKPDPGYGVSSVNVNGEDNTRFLEQNGDGYYEYTLPIVREDSTISVTFEKETINTIISKSYAVLQEETQTEASLKLALAREIGYLGYVVDTSRITVSNIDVSNIENIGYGTFSFTVKVGEETSNVQTGYIVSEFSDVIFKYEGYYKGNPIEENGKIRIAHAQDGENHLFTAPAMDSGTIEIFGPYYTHIEGWLSPDVMDAFKLDGISKLEVLESFYRVQLHIENKVNVAFPGDPNESIALNWFAFDLIQDDAYCVKVHAKSDIGTQRTFQWDLNRYAILNGGNYVSEVFFGNDIFELSIPQEKIGGVETISLETGDFQGYIVTETQLGKKFEVLFKSDFYDNITLNVTLNNESVMQLTIHRVGVQIQKEIYNPNRGANVNLFHGTQYGTKLEFSDNQNYQIYATYCIPDSGTQAPYGLYVTYTFEDGSKTSRIITQPCNNPSDVMNAEDFVDGVFIYNIDPEIPGYANCCDYLIYSAKDGTNAPVRVCVTVLKGNPLEGDNFEGIFLGSGAGVEWINE